MTEEIAGYIFHTGSRHLYNGDIAVTRQQPSMVAIDAAPPGLCWQDIVLAVPLALANCIAWATDS